MSVVYVILFDQCHCHETGFTLGPAVEVTMMIRHFTRLSKLGLVGLAVVLGVACEFLATATPTPMPVNHPPQVGAVPDVLFYEDQSATGIDLNNYVNDTETSQGALIWSADGYTNIVPTIDYGTHVLTFKAKPGFSGSERITLVVADQGGGGASARTADAVLSVTVLPVPKVLATWVEPSVANALIMRVHARLNTPAKAYVEYGNASVGRFRTRASEETGTSHGINVLRLRPSTTYTYQVFAADPQGRISEGVSGAFTTGSLDNRLHPTVSRGLDFLVKGQSTHDLYLVDVNDKDFSGIVAIDSEGKIVWYYHSPIPRATPIGAISQKPNFNIVFTMRAAVIGLPEGIMEISPLGAEVYSLARSKATGRIHHEVRALDNNRLLFLSEEVREIDNTASGGSSKEYIAADLILELDQSTGEIVQKWSVFNSIPVTDRTPMSNRTNSDSVTGILAHNWTHGNGISIGPRGNILVSLRNLNQIISIAPDYRSIEWRLGGPGSDFRFPNDGDRFLGQHSITELPNGNILTFDNGDTDPTARGWSRGLELKLDFTTMTATKVWEYRHDPDLYSATMSNAARLKSGNTVMNFNLRGGSSMVVEADLQGNLVWEVQTKTPNSQTQYRINPIASLFGETRISD
ncbi:MAG: hypothetical protein EXR55_02905 [Dehalococcoidia bacterium]|nr:hypothetical protein [Dehalococcoidia bacterium]